MFLPHDHVHVENRILTVPRLPMLTDKKIKSTLAELPPLRSLNIDLFDMSYGRLPHDSLIMNGLKNMLSRSAPELLSLSFSLATPGEYPGMFHRNNSWSHRHDDPAFCIYWTDLFGDNPYPELAKIFLRNIGYFGGEVGQYLLDNASTLQSVRLATWDCNTALPSRQLVHALWNTSKEALSLPDAGGMRRPTQAACVGHKNAMNNVRQYYKINAAKLADMMLFQNTHPELLDKPSSSNSSSTLKIVIARGGTVQAISVRPHMTYLESGAAAMTYRSAMETLTADELSYRGTVKEQLVLEYDQSIMDAGRQRMGRFLLHWIPNMQLYVFIFNDEPSLFLWTKYGFQHFVTVGEGGRTIKVFCSVTLRLIGSTPCFRSLILIACRTLSA